MGPLDQRVGPSVKEEAQIGQGGALVDIIKVNAGFRLAPDLNTEAMELHSDIDVLANHHRRVIELPQHLGLGKTRMQLKEVDGVAFLWDFFRRGSAERLVIEYVLGAGD